MNIRSFQPGDEPVQVSLYNAAACLLPGFKPAKVEDVQKRTRVRGFDPATRWYAEAAGEVVGYCVLEPQQGRVSFPWCKRGHDVGAELFAAALAGARARGLTKLFAAYRHDWHPVQAFFERQGFALKREMVNFATDMHDLPTTRFGSTSALAVLERKDLPEVAAIGAGVLQLPLGKLDQYFFANLYFPAECVRLLRSREDGSILALSLAIEQASYADVKMIDSQAPCFRLGAFGTEGLNTKRVNGLFSFLVRQPESAITHGLTLLADAVASMTEGNVSTVAAQAPSDALHLMGFYNRYFKEQGRFPVYERELG